MSVKYSLVIPCYIEAANFPALVQCLVQCFSGKAGYEIVLVDNGSSDDSPSLLADAVKQHPFIQTVRVEVNQGYGWGILQGLAIAKGNFLGWTHADLQTDPADAIEGFEKLESLANPMSMIKGRRYGRPFADVFFTTGMSIFDSILFGLPLWDINAQPTLFSRPLYTIWREPPRDFSLDLYAYATAVREKAALARIPVHFGKRLHGLSHWNINWPAQWKFIKKTMEYSLALKKAWKQNDAHHA
jgi:glycosyltransferase involved in cell wall biosynthesis